jgi:hypothetical protein
VVWWAGLVGWVLTFTLPYTHLCVVADNLQS